jgi:hypothetical protein
MTTTPLNRSVIVTRSGVRATFTLIVFNRASFLCASALTSRGVSAFGGKSMCLWVHRDLFRPVVP